MRNQSTTAQLKTSCFFEVALGSDAPLVDGIELVFTGVDGKPLNSWQNYRYNLSYKYGLPVNIAEVKLIGRLCGTVAETVAHACFDYVNYLTLSKFIRKNCPQMVDLIADEVSGHLIENVAMFLNQEPLALADYAQTIKALTADLPTNWREMAREKTAYSALSIAISKT